MRGVWLIAFALLFSRTAANAVESAPAVSERATVASLGGRQLPAWAGCSRRAALPPRAGVRAICSRNPGDAGSPPEVTPRAGRRQAGDIAWPAPGREAQGPVTSYVYSGDVLLPVRITPPSGERGAQDTAAAASWLVCGKICVPEEGRFRLSSSPAPRRPGPPRACSPTPMLARAAARSVRGVGCGRRVSWPLGRVSRRPPFRAPGSIRSRGARSTRTRRSH